MEPYARNSDTHGQSSDPLLAFHQVLRLSGNPNTGGLSNNAVRQTSERSMPPYAGEALFTCQGQQMRGPGDIAPAWNNSSHPPLGKHP